MRSTLDPTLDVVFKMLLAPPESRDILTALVTAVLRPEKPIVHVEVLDPHVPKEDIQDKGIVLDLRVKLQDGTLLDLEMQSDKEPAFRNRAVLYWARLFNAQIERGEDYGVLRPAVLVLFLGYDETRSQRLHSVVRLLEVHDHKVFSDVLQVHLVELPNVGRTPDAGDEKLAGWARFFAAATDQELEEIAMTDPMIAKAKGELERLSADPEARERARWRELSQYAYRMNLSAAKEEGREVGREEGREVGREVGREEGREEGQVLGLRMAALRHFRRRLGRPLTEVEENTVSTRMDLLGPDRMDEVVFELAAGPLAAWLADPQAR
jgi:predicted transposase/invertase (TIGR01784 family)